MKIAIVGGGAAGFFAAINMKEMQPAMQVSILERSERPLAKVEISGGGRCNVTNSFRSVGTDLAAVYPRGHRLMGRLFRSFGPRDAYEWFEQRGVRLVTQDDDCVFPQTQDARTISHLFLSEARRLGIDLRTGQRITSLDDLTDYDAAVIAIGGQPRRDALLWLRQPIVDPVPSLFTLSIDDPRLHDLMGTVVPTAQVLLPGTRLRADGPLLITHWGMSGPAILRLSSYGARLLSECGYRHALAVNWLGTSEADARQLISRLIALHPQRQIATQRPDGLQQRLWQYLVEKSLGAQRARAPWVSLNQKEQNRLLNTLTNDTFQTSGRAPHRDEFVTCGGVALTAVNAQTLESRTHPGLYFCGEVLDIDGVTGGFNFQAAWTTAHAVARALAAEH